MAEALYTKNLDTFRTQLDQSPNRAYGVYGLTLLYSLSPDEVTREKCRLGIRSESTLDIYNLGVLASKEGRHEDALKLYLHAVEVGGDFAELYFNLGLTYEQLKQKAKAADAYQKYADLSKKADSEEARNEVREIKAHIKQLRG
jgi:tetratricopeptide (TPR) repeat protein